VPRLWDATIETHRNAVRDATLDATAALVARHGLRSVTMSQIAQTTGIGRATLYKYFPDVDAILLAWHERQVSNHLEQLHQARDQTDDPGERLEAVLAAYARVSREAAARHDSDIAAVVHRGDHLVRARDHLQRFMRDVVVDAVRAGEVRDDIGVDELSNYCLHALAAAGDVRSKAAVNRLVALTLDGLRADGGAGHKRVPAR
jgi:AcrR family transcriptional regulator